MPSEFPGMDAAHDRSETRARSGAVVDEDYALRLARSHEDNGGDGERFDRVPWTATTATATGGAGGSNALAGTPGTLARALSDHVDVDILPMRGYSTLNDSVERRVIPIVREEVARRGPQERGTPVSAR